MHTHLPSNEKGNAVALTLLGLAVAILAGVAVLYILGKNSSAPNVFINEEDDVEQLVPPEQTIDPRSGWNIYENSEYGFSFRTPSGWIVATGTVRGAPVITAYDARQFVTATTAELFDVHEAELRVSVYPEGLPGSGEGEKAQPSETIIPVPQSQAVDYVLTSGRAWATKASLEQHPESWAPYGFMFGRVPVEEEEVAYMRGETSIAAEEFDPYLGDEIALSGYVDTLSWDTMSLVLSSFSFNDLPRLGEAAALDPITVTTPTAGATISSPLLVSGEAQGSWYFEASFPVRLVSDSGEVLAEVPAQALDDWMTESYVPFSVSLVFTIPESATSGTLILRKDNPSGLPELDDAREIPVLFRTE